MAGSVAKMTAFLRQAEPRSSGAETVDAIA
jgi:hypothetical protein